MRYLTIIALLLFCMACLFCTACRTTDSGPAKYQTLDQVPPGEAELVDYTGGYMECSLHAYAAARLEVDADAALEAAQAVCAPQLDAYQGFLAAKTDDAYALEKSGELKEYTAQRLLELGW